MSYTYRELRGTGKDKLIEEHDEHAKQAQPSVSYYLEEIYRRDQEESTNSMLCFTKRIYWLTVIITIATIINILIFFFIK